MEQQFIIWLVAGVLGLAAFFAQFRLFHIADTLDKALKEIQLLRLEQLRESGRLTSEEFENCAQNVMKRP